MHLDHAFGLNQDGTTVVRDRKQLGRYLSLKLLALGVDADQANLHDPFLDATGDLLAAYREKARLLFDHLPPVDQRIQDFLDRHLGDIDDGAPRLPGRTLVLDRHGLARELSLPRDGNEHNSPIQSSRRLSNGIVHNPLNDRRTTKGVFHIAEGGLPIADDKKSVPLVAYRRILKHAVTAAPSDHLQLPWLKEQDAGQVWVSLLLRPLVVPEVPGWMPEKRMEIRFFTPGGMVANLDFVESIFGNAGDPSLPRNDAGLDQEHWSGQTGCVILAPHVLGLPKKDLGLPHISEATERQKRDGMCWEQEDEKYNDGTPFKITHRDESGVMVTIIADNYFGYCKKEVKTQISFASNLYGLAEEEHAGGALAFPRYNLGEVFVADSRVPKTGPQNLERVQELLAGRVERRPQGHLVDTWHPEVIYVPAGTTMSVPEQTVSWSHDGQDQSIKLLPGKTYVHPTGYQVHLEKHPGAPSWRLIGTAPFATFCHKPSTVSGGGKSEISKSIVDAVIYGSLFVNNFDDDMDQVQALFERDYSDRLKPDLRPDYAATPSRSLLDPARSLGSVIKLFTPSEDDFTPEYNAWLKTIPTRIQQLVFVIKRLYQPEWGDDWRSHFHVDIVNGAPGHELKYGERKVVGSYLRVGLHTDGSWRTFKLRQDFIAARKVQMEDDISASVIVPPAAIGSDSELSAKIIANCEHRLFQRPDEAIHRGIDKQTEIDMSQPGILAANFEPLDQEMLREEVENVLTFDQYTQPMKDHLSRGCEPGGYVVSSALPRIVDGKPTKNPRYLQIRPDLSDGINTYLADIALHLQREIPASEQVVTPVDAVLPGRRNNPPQPGIRALAVYNPLHYQELPELFMDFVSSLTGKSPSTTGAGSEGALTKGPFNALRTTADLNNALLGFILCGHHGFTSAAGHIGANLQVDHDISMLVPELWCRLTEEERNPAFLIKEGMLEPLTDFEHDGRTIMASRLGYRITGKFVHTYLGRIFASPAEAFDTKLLQPESQDYPSYVDGIENICEAHERVAKSYLSDGSVAEAIPPLAALLHIMAEGSWNGKTAHDPEFRAMFTREAVLGSEWYQDRLRMRQQREVALQQRHIAALEAVINDQRCGDVVADLDLSDRLADARTELAKVSSPAYLDSLQGTVGADPLGQPIASGASEAAPAEPVGV